VNQIRRQLTYANVMSSIAVFLILGGATAFAAANISKIGSNQLKANAVTTGKIKKEAVTRSKIKKNAVDGSRVQDGSLTGADINVGSLGTVPSAANANNANTVGGRTVTKIFAKLAPGTSQTVATFGSYSVNVVCSGGGNPEITLAIAATDGDYEAFGTGQGVGAFFNRAQGLQSSIDLDGGNIRGITTFSAAQSGGFNATGTIGYDDTNTFNEENVCAVYGQVIS
jgi:hypothetical protein